MMIRYQDVAVMLGKSISTVKRLVRNDPYFPRPWRRKGTLRFRSQDVEKYMRYLENRYRDNG
jgi:predicted DNA-binding transcriptional regulator AlpA